MNKINRNIKSSVFADIFQGCTRAKEYSLELFNSLNDTHLDDPNLIEHITIDDSIYRSIKNDVAFRVGDRVVMLVEHQSTINPNMPLRAFMYMGDIYKRIIDVKKRYRRTLTKIPVPEIFVFYNGEDDYPDEEILSLKDAFFEEVDNPPINVFVKVYNINPKGDAKVAILEKCEILKENSEFIDIFRRYVREGYDDPARQAIDECMKRGILVDYLREAGDEIMNYLNAEYDYDMDIQVNREEAFEEGKEQGLELGLEQGLELGVLSSIKNLMDSMNISAEEAVQYLKIPEDKRAEYLSRIK